MASPIVKGTGKFGVSTATDTLAQSYSSAKSANETLAINSNGEVVGVALTQITNEQTVEVLVGTESAAPEIGGTYAGLTGVVTGFTKTESNSDFQRYSVTVKTWDNVTG